MGPATFTTDPGEGGILGDPALESGDGRSIARELTGGLGVLVALFIALCLLLGEDSSRYVGPIGESLRGMLTFLFGKAMSFLVPLGIGFAAVRFMLNRSMRVPWGEMLGAALIVVSLCGFLALPTADVIEMRQTTFARAGAIGAFMVDWEGVGLVGAFGTIGAGFVLGGMLFAGSVLTTGFGLTWAGERVIGWLRRREANRPQPSFAGLPGQAEDFPTAAPPRRELPRAIENPVTEPVARKVPVVEHSDEQETGAPFGFDSDAEAALRALEAAEMDREFEIALQRELAGDEDTLQEMPAARPAPAPREGSANDARERVSRLFAGAPTPREQMPARRPDIAPLPLPPEPELDATGDAEFDALMARAAAAARPSAPPPATIAMDPTVLESREDDPLFDDSIETRPRGRSPRIPAPHAPPPRLPSRSQWRRLRCGSPRCNSSTIPRASTIGCPARKCSKSRRCSKRRSRTSASPQRSWMSGRAPW